MFSVLAVILPLTNFFLQSWPRFFKKSFGVDVWTRLLEADHVRKNNHKIPTKQLSDQFLIPGYFDYPPVFPILLSYFSKERIFDIERFVAPFFDSLQVLSIYFFSMVLFNSVEMALAAQLCYVLTPMIALENSYLTPRSFGYLNFTLATLPILMFHFSGNMFFLFIGFFFSVLIFLTHRFATQSFLFIVIFFTYYLNSALFSQIFFASLLLAIILTKGYYFRVLKGHISNIYFWVLNLEYRFAHQIRGVESRESKMDWVQKIYSYISLFSPIAMFGMNPWAISGFLILILHHYNLLSMPPVLQSLAAWILFFYFLGVIVLKTKILMPIGEGQRYMEMATVPASILSSYIFFSLLDTPYRTLTLLLTTICLLVCLAIILVIQIKGILKDSNRSLTDDIRKTFTYINKAKKPFKIICIPHQNTTLTIYHTNAKVLVNADNPGLLASTDFFPILKQPLKVLKKRYGLTHALIRTNFVTLEELKLKNNDVEFKSGQVMLVRI